MFDYSSLDANTAKLAKESAIEIKAREKAIWENIIEIGNRLIEVKNVLPHGSFQQWVKSEFDWSPNHARKYMTIAQEIKTNDSYMSYLPNSMTALYQLASGLANADEETKEEILEQVGAKTEEKGKALTEKEINELPAIKELKEKLKAEQEAKKQAEKENQELKQKIDQLSLTLENTEVRIDNVKSYMESQIESKERELNKAKETLENQHKQIQELNSAISAKESALATIETKSKDLTQREEELELLIEKKANAIAEETIESEKAKLRKKEEELKQEQEKIKKELAEVKKLKSATEKEKIKLSRLDRWIEDLTDFNSQTDDSAHRLLSIVRNLQDLPDLDALQASDREIVSKRIYSEMQRFHDITETYGAALNNVAFALRKLDNTVLKAVDVEVING